MKYSKREEKERKAREKTKYEDSLVCMFTESETYEEFRVRASLVGYEPKSVLLCPFWWHKAKQENGILVGLLGNMVYFLTPIVFTLVFLAFGLGFLNGMMASLPFLLLYFIVGFRFIRVSTKIEYDEKWMESHGGRSHLYGT